MARYRIHLPSAERFPLWGRMISVLIFPAGIDLSTVTDDTKITLRTAGGRFAGTLRPSQSPDIMNAITSRRPRS